MEGQKIELVKKSLKILTKMMDQNGRLALILFHSHASIYFDLDYMIEKTKAKLIAKIDQITATGYIDILSGLKLAVGILKREK